MKKLVFTMPFGKKTSEEQVSFFVVDDEAKNEALKALSKVKIPAAPSLHGLEKAYLFGDFLRRKLSKNEIRIIQKKDLTKEEAYKLNVKVFDHLIEQRNAIIGIIEKMIQPLIRNVAGVNVQLVRYQKKIDALERQVKELRDMLEAAYGRSPIISPLPDGKMPWSGQIKEAAIQIIINYGDDSKAGVKKYRHLRDASDRFFDQHKFIYKPDLTKDMLYENVKKANAL